MDSTWKQLKSSLESEQQLDRSKLASMERSWDVVKSNAETILADKDTILYLNTVATRLNETLPELQQEHIDVVDILVDGQAPGDQVAKAQEQAWLAERIGRNIDKMLAGSADAESAADQFNKDARSFGVVLEGLRNGDRAMGISRVRNREARTSLDKSVNASSLSAAKYRRSLRPPRPCSRPARPAPPSLTSPAFWVTKLPRWERPSTAWKAIASSTRKPH